MRLAWIPLALAACTPTSDGGGSADSEPLGDAAASDAAPADDAVVTDMGPDGPPPRTCDELEAAIRGAVADSQRCVLDTQCVVIGGPLGCGCGPVIGEPSGAVVHFNEARTALGAYGELLERCIPTGEEVCDTQPSMAVCNDIGRCELVAGGGCVPDAGMQQDPDAGPPPAMCGRLRDELLATVAAEGDCVTPDDCAVVAGSLACACNLHEGPAEGYGIRREAAARAQQVVDLLHQGGCPERESCGVPPAANRTPSCVGGTCRSGEAPACE